MIYLASPYSDPDPTVKLARFQMAQLYTAQQLRLKIPIFSPIVYGYQFEKDFNFAGDAETWKHLNNAMLHACSEVHVLMLPGWRKSIGVAAETRLANIYNKPISYMVPLQ